MQEAVQSLANVLDDCRPEEDEAGILNLNDGELKPDVDQRCFRAKSDQAGRLPKSVNTKS